MLTFVGQYAEKLGQVGARTFRESYPEPVFVALGRAGDIQGNRPSGTIIVSIGTGTFERSLIVGRVFQIRKASDVDTGPVTVGRTSGNDVVVPEESISRKHCSFVRNTSGYELTDLGSANGTLVDGQWLESNVPAPVVGGETLTLGRLMVLFLLPDGFVNYLNALLPPNAQRNLKGTI